jgi:hypothetical protein
MNVLELSPREFRSFLEEERQYRTPEQIDGLMRRYNQANSLSGKLSGLLAPQEGRRRATFFPASVPEGMSLFDAVRSNEAEFSVPQGIVDMVTGTVRGVESPTLAAQGRIPASDMNIAGFESAASAMGLASLFGKVPTGSLGANTLRVYHGGPKKLSSSEVEMRSDPEGTPIGFSVTDNPDVAEYYRNMRGGGSISEFDIDLDKANIISEKELYKFVDDLENKLDADASYEQIQQGLLNVGIDAIEYPDPEFGIRVVNPNILGANASKSAGLLSVASDVSARGDQILNMLKSGRGSEVTDAMLDMGDGVKNTKLNQYLAANYDLPMDEASRLARAREMGFEGNLFHGTDADILALDKEKFGLGENLLGKGFYTTGNPKRANIYVPIGNPKLPKGVFQTGNSDFTEGGNILPLMTRSSSEFDARQSTGKANALNIGKAFEGSDFDVEIKDEGDQVFIKSKTNPDLSVYIDSYQDGMITLQKLKDVFGRDNVTNILEEAGFTGLKAPESSGSVTRVNYNPQDVRTQFARFDPRLSHLSNVTAANASPISGLLAQSGVSSEQAQRIEDYLYRTGLLQ